MKTLKASLAIQRVKEIKNSSKHNMLQQAHTIMFGIQVCHAILSKYSYKKDIQWFSIYIKELSQRKTSYAGKLCKPTDLQMIHIQKVEDNKCSHEFKTSSEWMSQLWLQVKRFIRFERSLSIDEFCVSLWRS